MAKQWTCARCSTKNDEGTLTCTNCRMIRGAVVVPGSTWNPQPGAPFPDAPAPDQPAPAPREPSPGWQAADRWSASEPPATAEVPPVAQLQPPVEGQPTAEAGEAAPTTSGPSYWSSAGPGYPAETAAPQRLGRRVPVGWLIVVILLGVGAVASFITNASRSDTGEIINDGDMMATDLRVGDCFDLKDPSAEEISDVTAKPCSAVHEFELFWTGSMPEGDYPSEAAFDSFFQTQCVGAFQPYVGLGYFDSELDIYWLSPLEETWYDGDRSIQCAIYDPDNSQLTGSLKASAR
jgi:hypothetical protein